MLSLLPCPSPSDSRKAYFLPLPTLKNCYCKLTQTMNNFCGKLNVPSWPQPMIMRRRTRSAKLCTVKVEWGACRLDANNQPKPCLICWENKRRVYFLPRNKQKEDCLESYTSLRSRYFASVPPFPDLIFSSCKVLLLGLYTSLRPFIYALPSLLSFHLQFNNCVE